MAKVFQEIKTKKLRQILNNEKVQIIDIRPSEAYNGWKLKNENRGGHIIDARSFPYKWFSCANWIDIVKRKELSSEQKTIIYGYENDLSYKAAEKFKEAGYTNINIYTGFVDEWAFDEHLPMQNISRCNHLVYAEWLKELIETKAAPEYHNNKFVICHVHYRNPFDYKQGHIPEAVSVDTNTLESPKTWNRCSPEELKETLESLGIDKDTTVILYGHFADPDNKDLYPGSKAGDIGSMRAAAIMLYAGIEDVRVLNGGLQSWVDAGFEISTDIAAPNPVKDFGAEIPVHPEYFIDTPEAEEYIKSPNKNLVCVRSWPEYIGEVSGYNYIEKKGRIPGAVFSDCGTDAYHMERYRNIDHTMREFHETERIWNEIGITPDKHNAFYCGTGWRGSEAFLNAWLMGWPNVSVYDGGWFEWSNLDKPFKTGIPKNDRP